MSGTISKFIDEHFRHFNARALKSAADGYTAHLDSGGKMFFTMAGAMSTAELGRSLAEMIRQDKVHAISCTGANLEEDLFNLVAHKHYESVENYRYLTADDEVALLGKHLNRVTDTCIPEEEAIRRIEGALLPILRAADSAGEKFFPHEFLYQLLRTGELEQYYQIPVENSWMIAACEKNLPIFVPGWEDSTLGNIFTGMCMKGEIKEVGTIKTGIHYMIELAEWYSKSSGDSIGFFQIGGGIAGDFPICVVPMLRQDLGKKDTPLWGYFCQISDSTTSYGSYSGAEPNEKITWEKLAADTPSHVIESDATIVAPLVFAKVLGW
ncbi:MAG: deoxyhypusine synthase [Verrucomicrobiales bacterium]|jgi:deoxyhypusine synthase